MKFIYIMTEFIQINLRATIELLVRMENVQMKITKGANID